MKDFKLGEVIPVHKMRKGVGIIHISLQIKRNYPNPLSTILT